MDNHIVIARATALLAANGYALIRLLDLLESTATPNWALALVLLPAYGLKAAYGFLENPNNKGHERVSAYIVVAMLGLWLAWRLMPAGDLI